MKEFKFITLALLMIYFILFFGACRNNSKSRKPDYSSQNDTNNIIVYIQDSSLYLYEQYRDTNYFVINIPSGFISNTFESISDSVVIIGYEGEHLDSAFLKRTGEPMKCPCSEQDSFVLKGAVGSYDYYQFEYSRVKYKAINIYTKEIWTNKTVDLKLDKSNESNLGIRTTYYNQWGGIMSVKDTVSNCDILTAPPGLNAYNISGRFISRTKSVSGKMVEVSEEGSLYLNENGSSNILLENKFPKWLNKCRNGYLDPDISPDGNWVVFREMASDWEYFGCKLSPKDKGLFEINIQTKELKELIPHNAIHPIYSPVGRYILLSRNQYKCVGDKIVVDIVILDRLSGKLKIIGIGDFYVWMKHKNNSA